MLIFFSIHPRDKQTTADRLANSAKRLMYNMLEFSTNGPIVNLEITIDWLEIF